VLDVDSNVLTSSELIQRVSRLVEAADATIVEDVPQPQTVEIAAAHAAALHTLRQQVVLPELGAGSGVLARAKRLTKRATQKLMWWYVEPRWRVQHDFDAHAAHFASTVAIELRRLSSELESQREHQRDRLVRLSAQLISAQTRLARLSQTVDEITQHHPDQETARDDASSQAPHEAALALDQIRGEFLAFSKDFANVRSELADVVSRLSPAAKADITYGAVGDVAKK
jgi:hypothetical protein